MHLYALDQADGSLELLPMAARRALDKAGVKLGLAEWQKASHALRSRLVELGSQTAVDSDAVRVTLGPIARVLSPIAPVTEPPAHAVPDAVRAAFGPERPIPDATWTALSALDRYVLWKVAGKARPERLQAAYDEIVGASAISTHLEPRGGVRMVDVAAKAVTHRTAVAVSRVLLSPEAFSKLHDNPKGDVLATARLAGIMAGKKTSELIPLCHPLPLTKLSVELEPLAASREVLVRARVECIARTGVEMEALTAASVAALTLYDMLKAFDKGIVIGPTQLEAKTGGRSGDYTRPKSS